MKHEKPHKFSILNKYICYFQTCKSTFKGSSNELPSFGPQCSCHDRVMSITLTGWCTVNCTFKRLELSTRTLIFQFSYEKIDVSRYVCFFSRRFKYLNLRVGPLQYILWLGTNGGLGELFQDVWQFRRNVDLL